MNFVEHLRITPEHKIDVVPLLNLVLLLMAFIFIIFWSSHDPLVQIKTPKAVTSDMVHIKDTVITITSENILYVENKIMTLPELKDMFSRNLSKAVFIKVDRRASVGRIVDVWNMARVSGIERVSVASDKEE